MMKTSVPDLDLSSISHSTSWNPFTAKLLLVSPVLDLLLLCLLSMMIGGCSSSRSTPAPAEAIPLPQQWRNKSTPATHPALTAEWWGNFGDPTLTRLVAQALRYNTDIRTAATRVEQARALNDVQNATNWPTLSLGIDSDRSQSINAATGKPYLSTVWEPQFQAAYEVDLWQRLGNLQQSSQAQLLASKEAADSITLSVTAEVAASYIQLRELDARLEVAQNTLVARREQLRLNQTRQDVGYNSALETQQSEAEYRATALVIPQLQLSIQRQELALNVLIGEAPGPIPRGLSLRQIHLALPPDAGIPSELLRRRPDIGSAEAQLASSDQLLAASRKQLLPSLQLTASLGRISSSALTGDPFGLWSAGGSILAPIFEGGKLHAQIRLADAKRREALINYQKTVLTAFSEVEEQLSSIALLNEQYTQADAQRVALQKSLRFASNRYREGYASYLDELDAQRNLFNAEQTVLQIRSQQLTSLVNLYRVLGGGWSPKSGEGIQVTPGEQTIRTSGE